MVRPIIFYRGNDFEKSELSFAQRYFYCTNRFPDIKRDDFVIGRYSMYPYYNEYAKDIHYTGAKLINSYNQHLYIADLQNYVSDLKELTPRTWKDLSVLPDKTAFVLKGETNSKKSSWQKNMFAANKEEAVKVHNRLVDDLLIGQQQIYTREYVPLFKYMDGVNGMPVTKEFRFFVAYGEIVSGDFYWQNYVDDLNFKPDVSEVPVSFLQEVMKRVNNQCNFYTIDVAQTINGDWIVIELNEGQQSGLSCNNPDVFYSKLYNVLKRKIM